MRGKRLWGHQLLEGGSADEEILIFEKGCALCICFTVCFNFFDFLVLSADQFGDDELSGEDYGPAAQVDWSIQLAEAFD